MYCMVCVWDVVLCYQWCCVCSEGRCGAAAARGPHISYGSGEHRESPAAPAGTQLQLVATSTRWQHNPGHLTSLTEKHWRPSMTPEQWRHLLTERPTDQRTFDFRLKRLFPPSSLSTFSSPPTLWTFFLWLLLYHLPTNIGFSTPPSASPTSPSWIIFYNSYLFSSSSSCSSSVHGRG